MIEINLGKSELIVVRQEYDEDDWYFTIDNNSVNVCNFHFCEIVIDGSFCFLIQEAEHKTGYIHIHNGKMLVVDDNPSISILTIDNLIAAFGKFGITVKEI